MHFRPKKYDSKVKQPQGVREETNLCIFSSGENLQCQPQRSCAYAIKIASSDATGTALFL